MRDTVIALKTAIAAILCEAKEMGVDVDKVCESAKSGLLDGGKPYRWASADVVITASKEIDEALKIANGLSQGLGKYATFKPDHII